MVALTLAIAGCKKEEPPPAQPAPKAAPTSSKPVHQQSTSAKGGLKGAPQAAIQKPMSSVTGTPKLQASFNVVKDPFKPFVVEAPPAAKAVPTPAAKSANLLPIQTFDLGKFRVAGIVVGLTENRALVMDPDGKAYVLKRGMPIGSNDGRVSRITPTAMEVMETYKDESGKSRTRTVTLALQRGAKK